MLGWEAMEERERGNDTAGGTRENCLETLTSQRSMHRGPKGSHTQEGSTPGLQIRKDKGGQVFGGPWCPARELALVRTIRSSGVLT